MDLETAIRDRYSARMFLPEPVLPETLERILVLAQATPSWCNTQPWQVLVTRGEATERFRETMYTHAASGAEEHPDFPFPEAYLGEYRERRKVCAVQLYGALGITREDKAGAARQGLENFRLFGAPHVAIVTTPAKLGTYGAVDCGLYVANFLLAARAHGVDTIPQAALACYPGVVRKFFGLPEDRLVLCGISFGYADITHPIHGYRTERAAVAEAVRIVEE